MTLRIDPGLAQAVRSLAEVAYPSEGAGLLVGTQADDGIRRVTHLVPLPNRWEATERSRRYGLDPRDLMRAEDDAERDGLTVLGVFHSHPDHPARPSTFDLQHALPFYSYLITAVEAGVAVESRAWRLAEDRSQFTEETVQESPGPEETA